MYRDRITLAVLTLSENEEMQRLIQTWWFEKGECGNDRTSKKVLRNHVHFGASLSICMRSVLADHSK